MATRPICRTRTGVRAAMAAMLHPGPTASALAYGLGRKIEMVLPGAPWNRLARMKPVAGIAAASAAPPQSVTNKASHTVTIARVEASAAAGSSPATAPVRLAEAAAARLHGVGVSS